MRISGSGDGAAVLAGVPPPVSRTLEGASACAPARQERRALLLGGQRGAGVVGLPLLSQHALLQPLELLQQLPLLRRHHSHAPAPAAPAGESPAVLAPLCSRPFTLWQGLASPAPAPAKHPRALRGSWSSAAGCRAPPAPQPVPAGSRPPAPPPVCPCDCCKPAEANLPALATAATCAPLTRRSAAPSESEVLTLCPQATAHSCSPNLPQASPKGRPRRGEGWPDMLARRSKALHPTRTLCGLALCVEKAVAQRCSAMKYRSPMDVLHPTRTLCGLALCIETAVAQRCPAMEYCSPMEPVRQLRSYEAVAQRCPAIEYCFPTGAGLFSARSQACGTFFS